MLRFALTDKSHKSEFEAADTKIWLNRPFTLSAIHADFHFHHNI